MLAGWSASAARFREDANAEEDLALGGYRDRLVVELAQNAADAAARAGVAGRLLLRTHSDRLVAVNSGAPLDAAGVSALATLRASAKRDDPATVGRFGVGFAAVLAVADEPSVGSRDSAGVRFSRWGTLAAIARVPELAAELAARHGHVPVLRLPWPADVDVPAGYDTAVILPWRDDAARDLVRQLLADVDAGLLLMLPGLREIVVEDGGRRVLTASRDENLVVTDVDGRETAWRLREDGGPLDAAVLRDRPTEERRRAHWSVTCAVALEERRILSPPPDVAPVLHAPTPTDEPLGLPALVIGSFPLDPARRHVAPGALADALVARAAAVYVGLAADLAGDGVDVGPLVPGALAAGALDAALRREVVAGLVGVPLLRPAVGTRLLAPADAVVVDGVDEDGLSVLSDVLDGLAAPGWPRAALDALGVRRIALADVVDELATLARPPTWWRGLYAALASADTEALAGLPVPLADGRTVHGARGVLLPGPDVATAGLEVLRLRVVHPDAVHPLLQRLGASPASPGAILADPAVRAAVDEGADHADPRAVGLAVLGLAHAATASVEQLPWLGGVLLEDEDGGMVRADELVLPGSPAATVLDDFPRVDGGLVTAWGEQTLERLGVLRVLATVRLQDVVLDPDELDDLDVEGIADWADAVLDTLPGADLPPLVPELVLVRDLDYVAPEAWPAALTMLAQPPLRDAVVDPVRVVLPDGTRRDVPSPASWWLRRHALVAGHPAGDLRLAGADERLAGLYEPVELAADERLLRAVGVRTTLPDLLAEEGGVAQLLARMLATDLPAARLRSLYTELALSGARSADWPEQLRVPAGSASEVVAAGSVVVARGPWQVGLPRRPAPLAAPSGREEALADVLGVDVLADRAPDDPGVEVPVPDAVHHVLPGAPETWFEHEDLHVGGAEVDWWVSDGRRVHAATTDGLARGLAWVAGRWSDRWLVAAVLDAPGRLDELLAESAFDAARPVAHASS